MNTGDNQLINLREQIDSIDKQIIDLINHRAELAIAIGKIKKQDTHHPVFYCPEREAKILQDVIAYNKGPIANNDMAYIFRIIMAIGLSLQQPLTIAFLGPLGTFSHDASMKHFGPLISPLAVDSISNVFQQVENNKAQYGIVPIENSTEGVVNHTLDELMGTALKICGEIVFRIHQHLLVNSDKVTSIKRIYSHPQSLAQCRNWLEQHFPQVEKIAVSSNAQAAQLAQAENNTAAIASDLAAEIYGLKKYAENIEDNADNVTRFLIVGSQDVPPCGNDKTTVLVYTSNQPGALANIVTPFAKHGVNIILPTLRPSRQKVWNYVFFLDIEGHINDQKVATALQELKEASIMMKILGSYPKAML